MEIKNLKNFNPFDDYRKNKKLQSPSYDYKETI